MSGRIVSILIFIIAFIGITAILAFAQKWICLRNKQYAWVLTTICFAFAVYLSIPNFVKSFYIQFSLGAFIASILYFLLLNIPAMMMLLISKKVS